MRRTYRSKKESGNALDPRDVVLTMDSKSSVFDAFYINNIKQTKREISVGPSVQFAASNRVRKRKYVKRLKEQEPVIRESSSTTAFLTPDKSFHVNKAPDPFDLLLNSTTNKSVVDSIKSDSIKNKQETKTYFKMKSLKKKKINYSSSDSTDSDKENSNSSTEYNKKNTSDVLSHNLLIEKEQQETPKQDESIVNIVNNLSIFKESNKITPNSENVFEKHRNSNLFGNTQNSPLCSTPFFDKYRGKSIYRFSPISINLNDSPNISHVSKENHEGNNSVIIVKDDLERVPEKLKEPLRVSNNSIKQEIINDTKVHSFEVQSPILPHRTVNVTSKTNTLPNLSVQFSLQTSELEPFLGFSKSTITNIVNTSNICKNLERNTSIANISNNEDGLPSSSTNMNVIENENNNASIDNSNSFESDENESLYDTCNSEDIEVEDDKQPIVVIERLNDSIFKRYYDKMKDTSDVSSNTQTSLSDDCLSDEYESFDDKSSINNYSDTSRKESSNSSEENSTGNELNNDNSSLEESEVNFTVDAKNSDKTDEEICVSFVTTRRRNEVTNDSFILSLDNSITSGSSIDKTVLRKDSIINDKTLVEVNMPEVAINECNNISSSDVEITEDIGLNNSREDLVDSPKLEDASISIRSSINRPSFTSRKSSKSPKDISSTPNEDSDLVNNKIMTRKSTRWEDDDARKSTLVPKTSSIDPRDSVAYVGDTKPAIVLQPGKRWERSLSIYRRMTMMTDHFDQSILDDEPLDRKGRKYRQSVISTMEMQDLKGSLHNETINSRRSTFVSKPRRSTIRIVRDSNASRSSLCSTSVLEESQGFLTEDCDDTIVELSKLSIADSKHEVTIIENFHDTSNRYPSARDYVLRRCNQSDVILFDECYPDTVLKNCRKIGEGVYGEVFLWRAGDGRARVLKVIPIAGATKVNGENQKGYHEIISEIVIAMELSALRAPIADIEKHFDEGKSAETLDLHSVENATDVFNEVLAVRCVYGSYPSRLLDLWELYDECKGSENDNPAVLPAQQQFVVLELANAGQDLESYQFHNAEQAYSIFKQVALGLAVAEEAFQFEHRDLHWGNVLIRPTDQKYAVFVVRGRAVRAARRGVAAALIDYSLSRAALGGAALYNDLAADDGLFDAVGDYQFEVYRLMRDKLGNDWKNFEPYTNILWLHYTVDKMITALRYTRTNTKIHKHYIAKLKEIKNRILDYGSAVQYVLTDNEL